MKFGSFFTLLVVLIGADTVLTIFMLSFYN